MKISFPCIMLILVWGQTSQTKEIGFENVTLRYDISLASAVQTRRVPSETIEGPDWEGPEHLSFALLNSYASHRTPPSYLKTPEFRIYRIRDFQKMLPETRETLAKLRSLLTPKNLENWKGEIPYLPQYAALQLFYSRPKLIESTCLSGIRFLTVYAQDAVEISNQRLEYTFSGISKDGKFYVLGHFPVFVPSSESDDWERGFKRILNRDLHDDSAIYRTYLKSIQDSFEKREEKQFCPDLGKLDQLIQSVNLSRAAF